MGWEKTFLVISSHLKQGLVNTWHMFWYFDFSFKVIAVTRKQRKRKLSPFLMNKNRWKCSLLASDLGQWLKNNIKPNKEKSSEKINKGKGMFFKPGYGTLQVGFPSPFQVHKPSQYQPMPLSIAPAFDAVTPFRHNSESCNVDIVMVIFVFAVWLQILQMHLLSLIPASTHSLYFVWNNIGSYIA